MKGRRERGISTKEKAEGMYFKHTKYPFVATISFVVQTSDTHSRVVPISMLPNFTLNVLGGMEMFCVANGI